MYASSASVLIEASTARHTLTCIPDLPFPSIFRRKRLHAEMWWESVIPMGIIVGMIFIMGQSQDFFHKAAFGKPKHPCSDAWDRAMEERDWRVREEAEAETAKSLNKAE